MFALLLQYSPVLIQRAFLESLLYAKLYSEHFTSSNSFNPHKIPCEVSTDEDQRHTQEVTKQGLKSTVWCQIHSLDYSVCCFPISGVMVMMAIRIKLAFTECSLCQVLC